MVADVGWALSDQAGRMVSIHLARVLLNHKRASADELPQEKKAEDEVVERAAR